MFAAAITFTAVKVIAMKKFFWVCWSVEITACFIWMLSELNPQYISLSPYSFIVALYLMIALAIRFAFDAEKVSVAMIAIPLLPFVALRSALHWPRVWAAFKGHGHGSSSDRPACWRITACLVRVGTPLAANAS